MKTTLGTAARGCPQTYPPLKATCTGVARAIAAMAREGAAKKNARSNLTSPPKQAFRRMGEPEWWGGRKLAETLGLGSSQDAFNRMATGSPAIATEKTVSFVRKLINNGLLPGHALDDLALSAGHARAMLPFVPLFPELRALDEFAEPPIDLVEKTNKLADDFRIAIAKQNMLEKDERTRVRQARINAVAAMLDLRGKLRRREADCPEVYGRVIGAINGLSSALNSVSNATWEIKSSPRDELAALARDVALPTGPDGQPAFQYLFRWIELNALGERPERARIIGEFCCRVCERWGEDPRLVLSGIGAHEVPCAFWSMLDLSSQQAVLSPAAKRFLEKITGAGGVHGVKFMLLMAVAERWYFADELPDCERTDFENRLDAVRTWAASMLLRAESASCNLARQTCEEQVRERQAGLTPTQDQVKRLVKELLRLDVRPSVEMNFDLPEPKFQADATDVTTWLILPFRSKAARLHVAAFRSHFLQAFEMHGASASPAKS